MPVGGVMIGQNVRDIDNVNARFIKKLANSYLFWKQYSEDPEFMDAVAFSEIAMNAVASSEAAMNAVASSEVARNAIWNSTIAWNIVSASNMAVGKYVAGAANLDPHSYTDIGAVVANETAMNVVATSEIAMNAAAASETAMSAVATSEIAMNAVAASETARNAIWNSETAWNIVSNSNMAVGKYVAGTAGLNPHDYADMDALASDEIAINTIWNSSAAWDAVSLSNIASGKYIAAVAGLNPYDYADINAIATSETAMSVVWSSDLARQAMWKSSSARYAVWSNINILQNIVETSGPNLISETPLNADRDNGFLTYIARSYGDSDWTAVSINDGGKYIVFVHFYSYGTFDWYSAKIASYDRSTDLREIIGGASLSRGGVWKTSNGLWVWFHDNSSGENSYSYARVWYIKV